MVNPRKKNNVDTHRATKGFLFDQTKKYMFAVFKLVIFFLFTIVLLPLYLMVKVSNRSAPSRLEFLLRSIWSKFGLWLCNVSVKISGEVNYHSDVYVANHVSWLDILTLQSILSISFVAKSEVKRWPVFGFLAKLADTVFIQRRMMSAKTQQVDLRRALEAGKRLCLFPEGTSTDGSHVLPFKSSLFEVFISNGNKHRSTISVQPVSLIYSHRDTDLPNIFGWWGDMNLIGHIFDMVLQVESGQVTVIFEKPLDASQMSDRKKLALAAELAIKKRLSI